MKKRDFLGRFKKCERPAVKALVKATSWKFLKREVRAVAVAPDLVFAPLEGICAVDFWLENESAILIYLASRDLQFSDLTRDSLLGRIPDSTKLRDMCICFSQDVAKHYGD